MDRESRNNPANNNQPEWIDIHRKEIFKHCHYKIPVYQWGILNAGQYVFPFSFMLPLNQPATFFQKGNRYIADISYHIEGLLEPTILSEPKLKYKQRFVIRDPIKQPVGSVSGEKSVNLSSCCTSKGTSVLYVTFEKNCYSAGETARVMVQLDNTKGQLANNQIDFKLVQHLKLNATGRHFNKTFDVVQRNLPGVPAGGRSDNHYTELILPSLQEGDFWSMKFDIENRLINERDSQNMMNNSTQGKLITSEYSLSVQCPMSGCCTEAPTITVPISIFCPDFKPIIVSTPPNWGPQVMNTMNLALTPQFQVTGNAGGMNMNVNFNSNLNQMGGGQIQMQGNPYANVQTTNVQTNVNPYAPNANVTYQTNTTIETQNSARVDMNFNGVNMTVSEFVTK